jgi:AraC-like DNA-binding protein
MILLTARDPGLLAAVRRIARPDEDVVAGEGWVERALEHGHARLLVCDDRRGVLPEAISGVPVLYVPPELVAKWERTRKRQDIPPARTDYMAERLRGMVGELALEATWVDRTLADLSRLAGGPLPLPFRSFTRRTLEFPARYTDLSDVAQLAGLSRGALKARFRRRGLDSPFTYQRWLRSLAVAETLSAPEVTVAAAANALGFTSDTNMCRMVKVITGATPGRLREPDARRWLLVAFARAHLTRDALEGWSALDDLFSRRIA